ncbi:hypothetical protein PMI35_05497 [Pseudomonas sp. GM78]|nr:hypothetical protein PMI35_05497 [Pseudomonas sp. GM78]
MLTFAVLALNLVALAGIVLGLLLRAPRVRSALELAYIHTSDLADSRSDNEATRALVWAFTRTALLNSHGKLSLRKTLVVSLISSVVFTIGLTPMFGRFFSTLAGTMPSESYLGTIIFYLMAWPGHFIYDYIICSALLRISKTGNRRSFSKQTGYMILAFSAASFLPMLIMWAYSIVRFTLPNMLVKESMNNWDLLLLVPFFWNAPTFLWLGVLRLFEIYALPDAMAARDIAILFLSSIVSSCIVFFDLLARGLVVNRSAMNFFANTALRLSQTNADHVFNVSMIAFTIGNGLCQLFGISIR